MILGVLRSAGILNVLLPQRMWSAPKVNCRKPGILYNIICVLCENAGIKAVYFGESGKNAYSRGKKHIEDFQGGLSSHCMTIHQKTHHPDAPKAVSNFRMVPVRPFMHPLDRQIREALKIQNCEADIIMNSGSEWRTGRLPRAAVTRE